MFASVLNVYIIAHFRESPCLSDPHFFLFFALTFEITVTMSLAKMLYLTGIGIFSVDNK